FVYGLCNIFGSMLAGNLLTVRPFATVKAFPFAAALIYLALLSGGSAWPFMGIVVVFWGILAGINGNINQYWISHAAPEAPDFANGLFLTAANLGCVLGTTISGKFIDTLGMEFVVLGGLLFCFMAAVVLFWQCHKQENSIVAVKPQQA
ncbi:MAG: MFS transporter, partial [Selenomonas sp.]|nr:MFS transporter [Selenomonas sp.]